MISHTVTNAEFIREVFGNIADNERVWSCYFSPPPQEAGPENWRGRGAMADEFRDYPEVNSYFSVSTVKVINGSAARRVANFGRLACVVVDDADGDLHGNWKLETSTGNYQVGFILSEDVTDAGIAERLHKELARTQRVKADTSGNNPVRYVRLPVGSNTKYQPKFPHVLREWEPSRVFAVEEVCNLLGLNVDLVMRGNLNGHSKDLACSTPSPTERIKDAELVRRINSGDDYHDAIMTYSARLISRGVDVQGTTDTIKGLMEAMPEAQRDERWRQRYGDIYRTVQGAVNRGFGPSEGGVDARISPLSIICAADLMPSSDTEIYADERVERTFTKEGFFVFYGESNSGKTFLALDMAASVARGADWMGRHTDPCAVLYLASESPQSVQMRLRAYKKRHGVDLGNFFIVPNPVNLFDSTADVDAVIALIAGIESDHGVKVGLIIGDTLARLSAGANENAGEDMAVVMGNCDRIKTAAESAFGLIHHSGKDAARGMRGWSGMRAHVDTEIEVTTDGNGGHTAEITKQRDLDGKGDRIGFRLDVVDIGVNQWGKKRTTCVVEPAEAIVKRPAGKRLSGAAAVAMKSLREAVEAYGRLMPETSTIPKGVTAVTVRQWRDRFEIRYGADGERGAESVTKAFNRSKDSLLGTAPPTIGISDPYVWVWS